MAEDQKRDDSKNKIIILAASKEHTKIIKAECDYMYLRFAKT